MSIGTTDPALEDREINEWTDFLLTADREKLNNFESIALWQVARQARRFGDAFAGRYAVSIHAAIEARRRELSDCTLHALGRRSDHTRIR